MKTHELTATAACAWVAVCVLSLSAPAAQGFPGDNIGGRWLSPTANNWPLIAIHATLMPDGRVLTYGTDGIGRQTGFFIYDVWDPSTGLSNPGPPSHLTLDNLTLTDIFCSSQVVLPQNGSVFMAGGDNWTGSSTTNTANGNSTIYANGTLSKGNNLISSRWYSSSTVLTNGEVYIQGGNSGEPRPEIRDLQGNFRELTGADTLSLYPLFPRNFIAPDGRVFGFDANGKMYYVNPSGSGPVSMAGQFSSANAGWNSSAAMYRPGKILQMGGNSNGAIVIDITSGAPVVTATQAMSSKRQWVSATVLADGRVLATGGSAYDNELNDVNNSAEIWDPATGHWTVGASGLRPRLYHSTALLLPDASVLVSGGGAPGPAGAPDINLHSEIYYPPYLFDSAGDFAPRPVIVTATAPNTIQINQPFTVDVGTANIQRVTLVKTGSVTHSVNMDQRFLELSFTASGGVLTVQAPTSAGQAPPGYYLLFVINNLGVPSVGKIVRMNIQGGDATPPSISITSPTNAATFSAATSPISLGGTASDDVGVTQVTWVNSLGGSGAATGTTTWTIGGIPLQPGVNVITVTARDSVGNTGTDTLAVAFQVPPPGAGIVAAYSFDAGTGTSATDSSGNSNTGTLTNGPIWTTGKTGGALQFDGVDDRVRVANSSSISLSTASTLEAWVYPTATLAGWRTILQKEVDAYMLTASSGNGAPAAGGTFNGSCCTNVYAVTPLAVNAWTHVATTYDGVQIRIYINGVAMAAVPATGPYEQNANPLWIGGNAVYGEHFTGKLDDIRIYNRALSAAEIVADMNIPVDGSPQSDTTAPVVTISSPTSATTYATGASSLALGGTASDNVGVTQVAWSNDRGGSGTATGTTSWTVSGIALQSGTNVVTVTARDAIGNTSTDTLTVTYTPSNDTTLPVATITGPTSASTYATGATPLSLAGTASDNVGVTQVTWSNDRGGAGTATGTTSWAVTGIALQSGANVLTVSARDAAGNSGTDILTVTYTPTAPANGLVAAYAFDDAAGTTAVDSSGNANVGTLTNGPVWAAGKNGGALQFDGVNDRVRVNDSNSLDLSTAGTFEAWVYPTAALSGWRTILQKEADAYLLAASSAQSNRPGTAATLNGVCCTSLYATAVLATNTWTHVAATYDGAQMRMYVNGTQVSALAATGTFEQNANPLWIGGNALYGEHFQGRLDDIRIYNRALAAAEVQADMNAAVGAAANRAPAVTNPGNQAGIAGVPVNLAVSAVDPDGDPLTYSATGLPTGLSIASTTGVISGAPVTAGSSNVVITVSDGKASTTVNLTWTVTVQNPLVLDPMPKQAPQLVNAAVTYTASARNGVNTQYKWYFGDGSESAWSSSPTVTHTFTTPTIFWVSVTARDDRGVDQTQSFSQLVHLPLTAQRPAVSTNIAIGGGRVWVVNEDNDSVSVFDATSNAKLAEIDVGSAPRALAIKPNGNGEVWVTNRRSATISVIDAATLAVTRTISLPRASQPFGLVFAPDGLAAYVALEALGRVVRLDPVSGSQLVSANVGPTPRHLSISAGGTRLYVSRFITPQLPGEETAVIATGANVGGEVLVLDTATMATLTTVVLRHSDDLDFENAGSGIPNYLGAATISPDGTAAWVPSKKDNVKRGILRSGGNLNHQNTVRAISSRIDLATNIEAYGSRVDHDNASLASAAAFDRYGVLMFVALETARQVAVVDAHNHAEFFRIDVGRAPQGLAVSSDGYKLYVSNFMDRTVNVYDLTKLVDEGQWQAPLIATLQSVATEKLSPTVLMGKQFFYDARDTRMARESYMSCASCHNDGGNDGRTWDLTGLGEGLRNTIALNGRSGAQGFLHWSSNFDEVQDFEGQIRSLAGGTGLMPDVAFNQGTRSQPLGDPKAGVSVDLDALAAYVASLNAFAKSPFRNPDGTLTADGVAGKAVFAGQNCSQCHGGANFTDSGSAVLHDIGTIKQPTSGKRLGGALTGIDSPTLRDVWSTAPYLHDGSAATLDVAVRAHSGVSIADADLVNLVAYLQQIDGDEPAPPPPANSAPVVTNPGAQTWTAGTAVSRQIVATDANPTDTLSYSASGLPAGLTINGTTGLISGVPTTAGTGSSTVTVNDGKGGTGTATFAWTVNAANVAPVVTNPGAQTWTAGTAVSRQIVATDANPTDTLSYSASGLPAGLTINGTTGLISGVPTTAGTGSSTVTVNDGKGGTGTATFAWTVNAADTQAPSKPTGFSITKVNGNPKLTWSASTDNVGVKEYAIYRSTTGVLGSEITRTTTTTWTDTGVQEAITYTYGVIALDAVGNKSAASALKSVTAGAVPTIPTGLKVVLANHQPQLTWNASTDNVAVVGYIVYRSTNGSLGPEVARTASASWLDTSALVIGTKYTYAIKAYDAAGYLSGRSSLVGVTVN